MAVSINYGALDHRGKNEHNWCQLKHCTGSNLTDAHRRNQVQTE